MNGLHSHRERVVFRIAAALFFVGLLLAVHAKRHDNPSLHIAHSAPRG
jgi:hypothetical protein